MADKCAICNEKLKQNELNKLDGTIIKVKDKENKNTLFSVCKDCQKQLSISEIKEKLSS